MMLSSARLRSTAWLLLLLAAILAILDYMYPGIFTRPWRLLPTLGGDGIKNEFTYLYQVLYGKGYWFEGMNYPFGEHIVYTDGQPLLSITLAWLRPLVPMTPGLALAVM